VLSGKTILPVELLSQIATLFNERNDTAKTRMTEEREALLNYDGGKGTLVESEIFLRDVYCKKKKQ
jgi:hypothetical protein